MTLPAILALLRDHDTLADALDHTAQNAPQREAKVVCLLEEKERRARPLHLSHDR